MNALYGLLALTIFLALAGWAWRASDRRSQKELINLRHQVRTFLFQFMDALGRDAVRERELREALKWLGKPDRLIAQHILAHLHRIGHVYTTDSHMEVGPGGVFMNCIVVDRFEITREEADSYPNRLVSAA